MNKAIRANATPIVLSIIGTALACTLAACVACVGFLATIQPAMAGGLSRTDTPAADRKSDRRWHVPDFDRAPAQAGSHQ
jgi:hypothetical protein